MNSDPMAKTLVVLTGPTGIGKSDLAIRLAEQFKTEILSCDSRQIYKELSIGTAVPPAEDLGRVKHHFIQTHSISEQYNASRYEHEALEMLSSLFDSYDLLFMVGGSMLYIDAVCNGIDIMPDADPEIRTSLKKQLNEEGLESLRILLKQLDPEYYNVVDLKNPNRLIHALEISIMTGKPYSSFRTNTRKERPFQIIKIGLNCDRHILHNRINKRVDRMIEEGLEQEAREFFPQRHLNSLNTVGYRELFSFMNGDTSKEKAIDLIKRNSRRYARKQLTWFRKDEKMHWFSPDQFEEISNLIQSNL